MDITTPALKPPVDDLLEVLGVLYDVFLPREKKLDRPWFRDTYVSRANTYDVLNGERPLTAKMARHLRERMQLFLDTVIEDRAQLEQVITELKAIEGTPLLNRELKLLELLDAALLDRSAATRQIQDWTEAAAVIQAQRKALGGRFAHELLFLIDRVIAERFNKGSSAELKNKLHQLCERHSPILVFRKGEFTVVIEHDSLFGRFGRPWSFKADRQKDGIPGTVASRSIEVTCARPPESWTREELLEFVRIMLQQGATGIEAFKEGCTTIRLNTTTEGARKILTAFRDGEFANIGVVSVTTPLVKDGQPLVRRVLSDEVSLSSTDQRASALMNGQLRRAIRRESFIRPWRRLRYLFAPSVALSPLRHTIASSDERAYASPGFAERWRSLRVDLQMTIFLWPLLTAALLVLALLPLPTVAIEWAVMTGLALAVVGAQPCSFLISPLACGAGVLAMGGAFGFAHGMIAAHFNSSVLFSRANILRDFFLSVTGGLVGLSAPAWRSVLPLPLIMRIPTM